MDFGTAGRPLVCLNTSGDARRGRFHAHSGAAAFGPKRTRRAIAVAAAFGGKADVQAPLTSHHQIASIGLPAAGMDRIFR